jgi:hypothetical protein
LIEEVTKVSEKLLHYGLGPAILKVLLFQLRSPAGLKRTTLEFLLFAVSESQTICAKLLENCSEATEEMTDTNMNPTQCGYRYFFDGTSHLKERSCWSLPANAETMTKGHAVSAEGCQKKTSFIVRKRQRSMIWFWFCVKHETVLGFHVIPGSEGRRDAVYSLYRTKQFPPKTIFVDFSCLMEEMALNYLPHFYGKVQFFHDIFHGYGHKCSERFRSNRISSYDALNTSTMEQFNSFLQPLNQMVKAHTTKVSYLPQFI